MEFNGSSRIFGLHVRKFNKSFLSVIEILFCEFINKPEINIKKPNKQKEFA